MKIVIYKACLSPVNILTIKSKTVSSPPGEVFKPDIYTRKHWWHIQHIASKFWSHWKKEYLMQKWEGKKTNFKIGDIVIVYQDNVSRNHWPMAKIINVNSNKKGLVLSVLLCMGKRSGNNVNCNNQLTRWCWYLGVMKFDSPPKQPCVEIKQVISRGTMWSCTMRECAVNFAYEGELVCQIRKRFVIPVVKDPLSNLIDLFLKTCLVLKNKSIKLKVINRLGTRPGLGTKPRY